MTMKDFGEIMGVGASAVNMYEKNHRLPDTIKIQKIASYFKVPIKMLFDLDLQSKKNEILDIMPNILNQIEIDLGDAYRDFIEHIKQFDREDQFEALSCLIYDVKIDKSANEFQIVYFA